MNYYFGKKSIITFLIEFQEVSKLILRESFVTTLYTFETDGALYRNLCELIGNFVSSSERSRSHILENSTLFSNRTLNFLEIQTRLFILVIRDVVFSLELNFQVSRIKYCLNCDFSRVNFSSDFSSVILKWYLSNPSAICEVLFFAK